MVQMATHLFGPAGLLEQDDGENWSQSTRACTGFAGRELGEFLAMGLGQDRVTTGEGGQRYVETCINEHGQRWFYRAWREWMTGQDWNELQKNTAAAVGTV